MRRVSVLILPCVLALFLVGCPQEESPPPDDTPPVAPAPTDEDRWGMELIAAGWEPPWRLEVERGGALSLTPVFGMDAIVTPTPEPVRDELVGTTDYFLDFDDFDMRIQVRDQNCQDPRTMETFEAAVFIQIDGRELAGCGSWISDDPEGG